MMTNKNMHVRNKLKNRINYCLIMGIGISRN